MLPGNFEPFPKNPHIIQIFTQIGRSEELGTGVRNVYKYAKAYSGEEYIDFEEKDVFVTQVSLGNIFAHKKKDAVIFDTVLSSTENNRGEENAIEKTTQKILLAIQEKTDINTGILYAKMLITMGIALYSTRLVLDTLGVSDYGI